MWEKATTSFPRATSALAEDVTTLLELILSFVSFMMNGVSVLFMNQNNAIFTKNSVMNSFSRNWKLS